MAALQTTSASSEARPSSTSGTEAPARAPGLLRAARSFLGRIRRHFKVDTFDVFLTPVPADAFAPPVGYRFAWATPADLERCDPFHTELDERERAHGIERLALGHRAVAAFHGDTIVFTMWVNPRHLNVPGSIKRRLSDRQWFIYKAFSSPEHRGRKLYQAGMRFVLAEMARAGKTQLVGYAHVKKRISRKGLQALDFESGGRFRTVSVPGSSRTFVSKELRTNFPMTTPRSGAISPPR
jgi:hypothetical protein